MEDEKFDMLLELLIMSKQKHGDQYIAISHLINMMKMVNARAEREAEEEGRFDYDPIWDEG